MTPLADGLVDAPAEVAGEGGQSAVALLARDGRGRDWHGLRRAHHLQHPRRGWDGAPVVEHTVFAPGGVNGRREDEVSVLGSSVDVVRQLPAGQRLVHGVEKVATTLESS